MSTKSDKRLAAFRSLQNHPWLGRAFKKMTAGDRALAESFIVAQADASNDTFEMAVNRLFLDNPNKPKSWTIICEMLSNANSASR